MAVITAVLIGLNTCSDFGLVIEEPHTATTITYYFFLGMIFFHWKEYILASWKIFGLAAIAGYAFLDLPHTIYLAPICITYVTIFLGVKALPELKWLRTRDYSYGVYLYGFPIIQAILALAPSLRGHGILVFALAAACTTAFAAMSWHVIERRALALKSWLPDDDGTAGGGGYVTCGGGGGVRGARMSDAVSMPLLRKDRDDPPHSSPPTSNPARDGAITERHNRASQGLLAVEIILFLSVLVFLSYGERIPIGP
jgi:hypothetical protein